MRGETTGLDNGDEDEEDEELDDWASFAQSFEEDMYADDDDEEEEDLDAKWESKFFGDEAY